MPTQSQQRSTFHQGDFEITDTEKSIPTIEIKNVTYPEINIFNFHKLFNFNGIHISNAGSSV